LLPRKALYNEDKSIRLAAEAPLRGCPAGRGLEHHGSLPFLFLEIRIEVLLYA
jgi:hypothetical protein